jgi:hypothetical protein
LTVNIGGLQYENRVKQTIQKVISDYNIPLTIDESKATGAFNRYVNDLTLQFNGRHFDIEIKGMCPQMGETSYEYDTYLKRFYAVKPKIDQGILELIERNLLIPKISAINKLLKFLRVQEPLHYNSKALTFPCTVTKLAWTMAVEQGLIKPIAGRCLFDQRMIKQFYIAKGVNYIQVQTRGLYHLGANPMKLPIPELESTINIEVRLKRSGSELVQSLGQKAGGVRLISTGRILTSTCERSGFSLDDHDQTRELFSYLRKKK